MSMIRECFSHYLLGSIKSEMYLFQVICIVLHLIIHYLMLTNYFWMFCEGLHLWLVLVVVSTST